MKQCPTCKTTYTDATLLYCLADGAPLESADGEDQTVVRPAGHAMRVDIPSGGGGEVGTQHSAVTATGPGSSNIFLKIIVGLLAIGFLIAAVVAIGALIYFNRPVRTEISSNEPPTPRQTASPASTIAATLNETEELRKQIADLEKRLNEQATSNKPADLPLTLPNQPAAATRTARVNSPGDGFLALRTFPNSEAGARILQIPHGAAVTVGGCLNATRIGNRAGRWCRASYNGYSGWVFDGWLVY